jgi:hypothetical protein
MNRRSFLQLLGLGAAGALVAAHSTKYQAQTVIVQANPSFSWDGTPTLKSVVYSPYSQQAYSQQGYNLADCQSLLIEKVDPRFKAYFDEDFFPRFARPDRRRIGRAIRKARRLAPLT